MKKYVLTSAISLLIGFTAGMNIGIQVYGHKHIWDPERNGLNDIDRKMSQDKSMRLAVIAITEKQMYSTQAIEMYDAGGHKGYSIHAGIVDANGKVIAGNIRVRP